MLSPMYNTWCYVAYPGKPLFPAVVLRLLHFNTSVMPSAGLMSEVVIKPSITLLLFCVNARFDIKTNKKKVNQSQAVKLAKMKIHSWLFRRQNSYPGLKIIFRSGTAVYGKRK